MSARCRRFIGLAMVLLAGLPLFGADTQRKTIQFLSVWPADQDNGRLIMDLSAAYRTTHPDFEVKIEVVSPNNLQQRIKILRTANNLPAVFAYPAGAPLNELVEAGLILDIRTALRDLGVYDSLDEGAIRLLERLGDGRGLYALPLGMNVEGIWYNKRLFAAQGLKPPRTWAELENCCRTLANHGIQPFVAGGKDRWPLSRLVNMYIIRKAGPTALEDALSKKASLQQPAFLEAARVIQEMAGRNWFGKDFLSLDYQAAVSAFLDGKAAMMYNGSWFLQDLNDRKRNLQGPEGIGFFNVPVIDGGLGRPDDYSANCGTVLCLAKRPYDEATASWLKYVVSHIGDYAMQEFGAYKGYRLGRLPDHLSTYTRLVTSELAKVRKVALWFEAKLDAAASQVALDGMQGLFLGAVSPQELFANIEKAAYRTGP